MRGARLRGPAVALAGAVLIASLIPVLAGCGTRDGAAGPGPASPAPSAGAGPSAASPAGPPPVAATSADGPGGLTAGDVTAVEQAVRAADGTLSQADQQLAGD